MSLSESRLSVARERPRPLSVLASALARVCLLRPAAQQVRPRLLSARWQMVEATPSLLENAI